MGIRCPGTEAVEINMIDRCIPGKRIRNWHRKSGADWASLHSYARMLAQVGDTEAKRTLARAWLAGKGVRP
jgi:hypothetical protein